MPYDQLRTENKALIKKLGQQQDRISYLEATVRRLEEGEISPSFSATKHDETNCFDCEESITNPSVKFLGRPEWGIDDVYEAAQDCDARGK